MTKEMPCLLNDFQSVSKSPTESLGIKKGDFFNGRHCVYCVLVVCLIQSYVVVCPSSLQSVCFPPSSSGRTGGAALASGSFKRVRPGSQTGGVFRISWHLGERFQLIWDPCVHFNGFSGE